MGAAFGPAQGLAPGGEPCGSEAGQQGQWTVPIPRQRASTTHHVVSGKRVKSVTC